MEEAKAVEYYNDLLQKGGNAARFKQGLGFGTPAPSLFNKEEQGSLGNFVKGSNLEKDADLHKDNRIENIRSKLKKREDGSTRVSRHPEADGKKSLSKQEGRSESDERGSREKSARLRRSSPSGKAERAWEKETTDKERTGRSRSPRRRNRRRSSRTSSDDSDNSQSSRRRRRRDKDRHSSRVNDSRKHGRRSSPTTTTRKYYEGRNRNSGHSRSRSRSRSRGRDRGSKGGYRQRRHYSPHSRREFSRSPSPDRSYRRNHTQNRSRGRADSPPNRRSDRRRENDEKALRSSGRERDRKREAPLFSLFSRAKEKPSERDYSEIPGEKDQAKANLLRPDTDAELHENRTRDLSNRASTDRWERFDFDKDAPLDDDAKLDYFGDGTGASDDTIFLKNTGSSFLSSHSQVTRETLVTATHEAAIFGPKEGLTLKTLESEGAAIDGNKFKDGDESPHRRRSIERDPNNATPSMNSVLSEQVVAMQQGGSWQDRVLKMRKAREVAHHS